MSTSADFRAQMEALDREFADLLPDRLDQIEKYWRDVAGGDRDKALLETLIRQIHTLSGSAATFGYPALSRTALALEKRLRPWISQPSRVSPEMIAETANLVRNLRRDALRAAVSREPARAEAVLSQAEWRLVYLVEDDRALARELSLQLDHFGYETRIFPDTRDVRAAIAEKLPDVLVVDIMLPEGDLAGAELLGGLRQELPFTELPVVIVTARGDIDARLAAARGGVAAYFVKPLDVALVVDCLNRLTQRHGTEPYRILIVDDDRTLAERYAVVLRQGGMQVSVLTRPKAILDVLEEEVPELVLMDVNMPDCSGPDLVKVLRQIDRFVSLPIVYLSTESDLERQLSALRLGGDDFLTKPLTDRHLLAAVAIRAERSRVLKALMTRDSLTGLLTHVPLKERLASEISRCERSEDSLAFSMLDLDRFKQINDRHGHLVGDKVLRALADLLKKRVRVSDTVGRYGGEEFGVILPECSLADARQLLEVLRESFGDVRFHGNDAFNVTFSAGVSVARPGVSVDGLIEEADDALYRAKKAGGNRVEVFRAKAP